MTSYNPNETFSLLTPVIKNYSNEIALLPECACDCVYMLIFESVVRFHGIWFGCCAIGGHSNVMPFNFIQYIVPTWQILAFFFGVGTTMT